MCICLGRAAAGSVQFELPDGSDRIAWELWIFLAGSESARQVVADSRSEKVRPRSTDRAEAVSCIGLHWVNSERFDLNYRSSTDVFSLANQESGERRMCGESSRNNAQYDEMTAGPKRSAIDDYLRGLPEDRRAALEDLRAKIRAIVPEAEECISYRMPAFRVNGVVIAGFRATAKGCSYYPFSGATLRSLARDVGRHDQTKGALHFPSDKPLPIALVRKLIKVRIAETTE
jgi:uncharacterized protein YdhG (YjbR/CyaY superfamily)